MAAIFGGASVSLRDARTPGCGRTVTVLTFFGNVLVATYFRAGSPARIGPIRQVSHGAGVPSRLHYGVMPSVRDGAPAGCAFVRGHKVTHGASGSGYVFLGLRGIWA